MARIYGNVKLGEGAVVDDTAVAGLGPPVVFTDDLHPMCPRVDELVRRPGFFERRLVWRERRVPPS